MKFLLLTLIKLYHSTRIFRSPACRFIPTCSDYAYQAIDKYGTIKGAFLSLTRVVRCDPWSAGGLDPLK